MQLSRTSIWVKCNYCKLITSDGGIIQNLQCGDDLSGRATIFSRFLRGCNYCTPQNVRIEIIFGKQNNSGWGFGFRKRGVRVGGYGSGRFGAGRKAFIEEALRLSIYELIRHGSLKPGRVTPVTWQSSAGQCIGKVHVLALPHRVRLHFRSRVDGEAWQSCHQTIELVSMRTNFGRRRLFRCPTCRRACRDVYGGRLRFECRKCRKVPTSRNTSRVGSGPPIRCGPFEGSWVTGRRPCSMSASAS